MAPRGKGVRIPLSLDKGQAEKDGREFASELRKSLTPTIDVVGAARAAFDALKSAISSVAGVAKDAISAAAAQEVAEVKLTAALSRRGRVSQEFIDKLNAENFARQQLLAISDDEQQNLQSKAALLEVEAEHLSKVTDATIGLAETTGQDLNAALTVVVKAYHGNTAALKKFGIQATDTDTILDELASRVDVARARADTFTGRINILTENFSELMEALGESVVRNEDVKQLFTDLNESLKDMIKEVQENGPAFRTFISELVQDLRDLAQWTRENKDEIGTIIQLFGAVYAGRTIGGLAGGAAGLAGRLLPAAGTAAGLGARGLAGLGGTAAGAASFGVAATAGTLLLLPSTNRDAVAAALEADMRSLAGQAPADAIQRSSPRFTNTAFAGQGADASINFDRGVKITVDSEKQRQAAEKAAEKAAREAEKRAEEAVKKSEDLAKRAAEADREQRRIEDAADEARLERVAETANKIRDVRLQEIADQKELQRAQLESQKQFGDELAQSALMNVAMFVGTWSAGLATGKEKIKNSGKAALGVLLSIAGDAMLVLGGAITAAGFGSTAVPFLIPIFGGPAGVAAGFAITAAGAGLKAWAGDVSSSARETVSRGSAPTRSRISTGFDQRESPRGQGGGVLGGGTIVNIVLPSGLILGSTAELARMISDIMGSTAELRFSGGGA